MVFKRATLEVVVGMLLLSLALGSVRVTAWSTEDFLPKAWQRASTWMTRETRQVSDNFYKHSLCIPTVTQILEDHEGRHNCVYNKSDGSRAVGVGYNLDDDVDTRKSELTTVVASYDQVYAGKKCLNDLQINALLVLDASRALTRAAKDMAALDDLCCDVEAVFADIQFSLSQDESLADKDFKDLVDSASTRHWHEAAKALKHTQWCEDHDERCSDDEIFLKKGCTDLSARGWSGVICAPRLGTLLSQNEEKHRCVYKSKQGYKAVGYGYSLEDDVKERKKELSRVVADYDKVLDGTQCLNDVQIMALLELDAKRTLDQAAEEIEEMPDWCCDVQAVFGDIFFSGGKDALDDKHMDKAVSRAADRDWSGAASALRKTEWCDNEEKRCERDVVLLRKGCGALTGPSIATA